jgi:hypothetical protein
MFKRSANRVDTSGDPGGDARILSVPGVNIADPLDMREQVRLLPEGIARDRGSTDLSRQGGADVENLG